MKKLLNLIWVTLLLTCSSGANDEEELTSCFDGVQNGLETGIDCGGDCGGCNDVDIPSSGQTSPSTYTGYNLVWQDEFETNSLDNTKWSYHLGNGCPNLCWWGNNELQFFTNNEKNLFLKEGYLIMRAIKENHQGQDYTSSRIHTDGKFEFQYGRVDIRAAMPSAKGTWTALWMLNKDYSINAPAALWPSGGEIDIVEYLGEDNRDVFGTAHFGSNLANHRYISGHYPGSSNEYDKSFFVYSIIWNENTIKWLINDIEYHSIDVNSTGNQHYPFNDEFFLLFSLSVGGNLPTTPDINHYPDELIIDYIRVFQQN